jgi:hypothetical protein
VAQVYFEKKKWKKTLTPVHTYAGNIIKGHKLLEGEETSHRKNPRQATVIEIRCE